MDSSRSSLPSVDRANSTLFKRYLEEQHKSVIKSNNYQQISRPINSTIQITHTHRQQQDTYMSKLNNNNNNQTIIIKRKYSNGRKPSGDISKQRTSHTSRFMKRFQRQHKNRDTIINVQKRDGRPRFEFHEPSTTKQIRTNQENHCTCLALSDHNREEHHHHHHHHHSSPTKSLQVPRLSLNELFHSSSQHRRQSTQTVIVPPPSSSSPKPIRSPLPMLPPTIDKSTRSESISNLIYPIEQNSLPSPSIELTSTINTETDTTLLLDPPTINLSDEYWPIINDLLQEISIEMSDKSSVDIHLEIEESLAQRIYECIVEQDDENENDTKSYSTTTNDSSALSTAQPPLNNVISHESNDLPSSPISTTTRDPINNREKYFQPIREPLPPTSFNNLDRNRHSTPFNRISQQIQNDTRSPFAQSLFEPVNLLRTVATGDNDDFNFFPSSFSFENHQNLNTDFTLYQQQEHQSKGELSTISYHHSLPFLHHLLPPRTTPIDINISAFKPIEPANTRSTTSFALKRPQVINSSIGRNWFGQS
ncbi:unnamed protein product [Rotaria sordida]|uniref:Uncharacterized protein n=2 Tax=Rotaria sordida TaxID=392033 RepID=A0A813RYB2_9BILA|nr:unnamed protein product [Rotaria sordida]CAF3482355.1 unnamed protein product [Rotaria sordida]